ncbi:MAG: hypothetical protein ABIE70_08980 [bacterium]
MNSDFFKSKSFLIPTLIWAVTIAVYGLTLDSGQRKHAGFVRTLIQWDARLYVSIARDGYERFPCPGRPADICGNGGWFPLYPILGAIVAWSGIGHDYSMLLVSWLAFWLALLMLYRLVDLKYDAKTALGSLLALAIFPGTFYYLTAFPYSVYLALAVTAMYLLERAQYRWLWLITSALAATYPSGALIGLPVAYALWRDFQKITRVDRLCLTGAMAAIPAAILIYFGYYWWAFGDFWLYLHIQSQSYYAHQATFPLLVIYRSLVDLPLGHPVFVCLVFVVTAAVLFLQRRLATGWQIYLIAVLLFTPAMGTTDCYYRHVVVAFPLFVAIALGLRSKWRQWLVIVYAVAAVAINWLLLMPAYRMGMLM